MRYDSLAFAFVLALSACNRPSGGPAKETATASDSATIDATTARNTALAQVPEGRVVKGELEQENGRLVYSYDIKQGARPGIEEVQIDAHDGSVVSVKHEDAAMEASEAKQDSAAAPK